MGDERFNDPGKTTVFPQGERGARADAAPDVEVDATFSRVAPLSADETAMLGARAGRGGNPGETQVLAGGADATQVMFSGPGETQVLQQGAGRAQVLGADATQVFAAGVAAAAGAGAGETQVLGADETQVFSTGAGRGRRRGGAPDAAFSPQGYIPEQAVNPQMMPDAAFEPRGAAYNSPSATSVMPAELIAERRKRNQKNAGQGARFAAGSFAQEAPAAQQPYAQAGWDQPVYAQQPAYAQPAPKKKGHGCLIVFITVLVVLVLLGAAAIFALDYAVQQTDVPKEEILSRLAKPVQDFVNGLMSKK